MIFKNPEKPQKLRAADSGIYYQWKYEMAKEVCVLNSEECIPIY